MTNILAILRWALRGSRAVYISELEIDKRRKFRPGHNPGVDVETRKRVAASVGIQL